VFTFIYKVSKKIRYHSTGWRRSVVVSIDVKNVEIKIKNVKKRKKRDKNKKRL